MKLLAFFNTSFINLFSFASFVLAGDIKQRFWRLAKQHPEVAYYFFKGHDSFMLFDYKPHNGYRSNLPSGEWDGPFRLEIPSRCCVLTIYGRSPCYKSAMQNFIDRFGA